MRHSPVIAVQELPALSNLYKRFILFEKIVKAYDSKYSVASDK